MGTGLGIMLLVCSPPGGLWIWMEVARKSLGIMRFAAPPPISVSRNETLKGTGLWTPNPKCFPIQNAMELGKARKEQAAYSIIARKNRQLQTVWEHLNKKPPGYRLVQHALIYGNTHYRNFLYRALKCRQFRTLDQPSSPAS